MGEIQFVPTEPAVDAWQKLQEMTKRAEELEAENIKLHGQVEFEHAKRVVAEYQRERALSYADHCYNAGHIGAGRIPWELYLRV